MHIIIIEPDRKYRDIIELNINEVVGTEDVNMASFDNTEEALGIIEILDDVALVVCKDNFESKHSIVYLSKKLNECGLKIPLLSIGHDTGDAGNIYNTLSESVTADEIAKTVLDFIKQRKVSDKSKEKEEELRSVRYKSVPINVFRYFKSVPFDFYIKLKKNDQYQFIKRLNKDELYEFDMIDNYVKKDLTHFYIDNNEYQKFTSVVNGKFKALLNSDKLNDKSKDEISKYVLVQLSSTGFSEANLSLATNSIKKQTERILNSDSKLDLLAKVYNSQLGFRFQRNYMISIIGSLIVKNSDWADSKLSESINMASYIHDMFLETEDEMNITSDYELDQFTKDNEKKIRIKNHALQASEKAALIDKIPADVVKIVRQHHGRNSGSGYSTELSSEIVKLSILFIVAEEVALAILKSPREKINLLGIFKEIIKKYNDNENVSKCLSALSKSFEKK
jgi:hypothetical protein